jgi:hypothetical protein
MAIPEIEEFGRALVERVRDAAIRSCDRLLDPNAASPVAKRWRESMPTSDAQKLAKALIPDIVDETISNLLLAIDQELFPLSFVASTGRSVDLVVEGLAELSGAYGGSPGWRSKYSKERFIDDFAHLRNFFSH